MTKKSMKSESKSQPSKKKKATKGKRPSVNNKREMGESFSELWQRENAEFEANLAMIKVYEAEMKKKEIREFRKRCESLGYCFSPSEEKLVDFYLRSKNSGKEIAYCPIEEVDVYANHPKGLIENYLGTLENVGYFFTRSRPNEIQSSSDDVQGHWIFREKEDVLNQGKKVGMKQVFEYCEGDHCTGYKIIEYQIDPAPVDLKAWFVCKLWEDESCLVVQNQA